MSPLLTRLVELLSGGAPAPEREADLQSTLARGPGRFAEIVAWAGGVACVLALAYRFRFGSELSDETFSIAMPYRFALGDKPFVDEVSVQQTAGILLFPFVWLYVKITGGTTGLVLFVRALHLLVKGVAGLCVYKAVRRWLTYRSSAIAVSFVPFAFVPHSIPNVGYNVLGMTLLVAGTFLAAAAVAGTTPDRRLLFYAGFALGLAVFAYPPMAIGPIIGGLLLLACAPSKRLAALGAFAAGGAFAVVLVLPSLAFGGVAGIRRGLAFGHDTPPGMPRVKAIAEAFWNGIPALYKYAAPALVAARLFWRVTRGPIVLLVPAITIALLLWFRAQSTFALGPLYTVEYVGAFAPFMLIVAKPDAKVWRGALLVMIPSFACGLATGVFSTQNATVICLGLYASLVLLVALATRTLERAWADRSYCLVPALASMYVLVSMSYDFVYRDAPMPQLTTLVTSGPFRGVYTTPDRAQMFAELLQITRTYDKPGGRALMLYDMPGLYLFSKMPPAARCVWEVPWYGQETLLAFWQRKITGKGYVVFAKGSGRGTLVDAAAARPERKLAETPHFVVYAEP